MMKREITARRQSAIEERGDPHGAASREGKNMVYYEDENLLIRDMETQDAQVFTDAFTAQGWHPEIAGYMARLNDRSEGKCVALTAVWEGRPAGYVYVYLRASSGPFREKGWPIIVDFNVLRKYQRRGIGNRLMDAAEQIAGRTPSALAWECVTAMALRSGCTSSADTFRTVQASGIRASHVFNMRRFARSMTT